MNIATAGPFACKTDGCGLSFVNKDHLAVHEREHEILHFSLSGRKSCEIFVADLTPTPTRLIKNCEEVGLFDDLRHVNPFEETFRRAVEQNSGPVDGSTEVVDPKEDSLHTPQVFPQLEANEEVVFRTCGQQVSADKSGITNHEMTLADRPSQSAQFRIPSKDSAIMPNNSDYLSTASKTQRCRSIAEKPIAITPASVEPSLSIQFVQPQVITLSFQSNTDVVKSSNAFNNNDIDANRKIAGGIGIPVQTVKPFILPKSSSEVVANASNASARTPQSLATTAAVSQPEPSSASLTPTSQLPIKERLKMILSNNSRSRAVELNQKANTRRAKAESDFMERRRAASTRYRLKMRSFREDLRCRNEKLQTENEKLRERIKQLEMELAAQAHRFQKCVDNPQLPPRGVQQPQIQIPAATVHLVMNIPQMIIPTAGQPIIKNPITFQVEKK